MADNVTRLMKGQAQVLEAINLLQRLVLQNWHIKHGLCVITNRHNFCLSYADLQCMPCVAPDNSLPVLC